MYQYNTKNWIRISKATARKMYDGDKWNEIYLLSCKLHPENIWQQPINISEDNEGNTFDEMVNGYMYYNCDKERGYYTSFYIINKWWE